MTIYVKQYAPCFTAEQAAWLETQAAVSGQPITEIIRQCVDAVGGGTPTVTQDLEARADSLLETLIKRFPDFTDMRTLETQTLWFDQYVKIIHDIWAFHATQKRQRLARQRPDPIDVQMAAAINERWD